LLFLLTSKARSSRRSYYCHNFTSKRFLIVLPLRLLAMQYADRYYWIWYDCNVEDLEPHELYNGRFSAAVSVLSSLYQKVNSRDERRAVIHASCKWFLLASYRVSVSWDMEQVLNTRTSRLTRATRFYFRFSKPSRELSVGIKTPHNYHLVNKISSCTDFKS
jgi:hypothetical protein